MTSEKQNKLVNKSEMRMKLWIMKTAALQRENCHLNLRDFPKIIDQTIPYARDFPPIKFFFSSVTLKALAFSCSKMHCELIKWRAWLFASTSINGVSLAHHISETNMVSYLSSCLFRNKHYALSEYLCCASPMVQKRV